MLGTTIFQFFVGFAGGFYFGLGFFSGILIIPVSSAVLPFVWH